MRYVRAFAAFWYDFLVGDRPELFAGPVLALFVAWLLVHDHVAAGASGLVLFVAVVAVGGLSLYLTTRPKT